MRPGANGNYIRNDNHGHFLLISLCSQNDKSCAGLPIYIGTFAYGYVKRRCEVLYKRSMVYYDNCFHNKPIRACQYKKSHIKYCILYTRTVRPVAMQRCSDEKSERAAGSKIVKRLNSEKSERKRKKSEHGKNERLARY